MELYLPEEYQPRCQHLFEYYQNKINHCLPQASVEHIGASAIPNAISKGDLDIYIGVSQIQFDEAILKLTTLNFKEKLQTLRTEQLCMLTSLSHADVALQLVVIGSEFENFITFRNILRQSPALVERYNQLKLDYANADMLNYRIEKNKFIEHV